MMTAQRYRDQPAGPAHPATQVEHGYAGTDASSAARCPDHAGTHEVLLAHARAGRVGGLPGPVQRRQERGALVLPHPRVPSAQPAIVPGWNTVHRASGPELVTGSTDRRSPAVPPCAPSLATAPRTG